jgi:hypothetical protein
MTSPLVEKTRDIILERKNTFCSSGMQARNKITYEYNQQYVCPMVFFMNMQASGLASNSIKCFLSLHEKASPERQRRVL